MRSRAQIKSHPIHPMLVNFPIGLWVTSLIFDLIAASGKNPLLAAAGFYCIIGGSIGAVLAAVAGVIDLFGSVPPNSSARQRGYLHGGINSLALLLFIAIAWYRGSSQAMPDSLSLLLSFIGVIAIGVSGWLGGTLVYRNQIGVDHRYANSGKYKERNLEKWEQPVFNKSELSDGQMMLVRIEDERIAVGLCGDDVFAISDHCTHKGGPLSDGALVGCTVQCPWHGSQFDVKTGRVVSGPAETKIKTYETETRGGEVYIKKPVKDNDKKTA
jgi:uncharacterized membrane protein/nitrite reductase/ring-hydroxylating ferredoxin subunit